MTFDSNFGFAYREIKLDGKLIGEFYILDKETADGLETRLGQDEKLLFVNTPIIKMNLSGLTDHLGKYGFKQNDSVLLYSTDNPALGRALYASLASQIEEHTSADPLVLNFNEIDMILLNAKNAAKPYHKFGCLAGVAGTLAGGIGFYIGLGKAVTELFSDKLAQTSAFLAAGYLTVGVALIVGLAVGAALSHVPNIIENKVYKGTLNQGLKTYNLQHDAQLTSKV